MPASLDSLQERLEERADLLEATRLRYRALERMLSAFFWRERIRANLELLREVAHVQPEVEATLQSVQRRAAAERWPLDSAPLRLLERVLRLRQSLERALARRLTTATASAPLREALLRLEEQVLAAGPLLGQTVWSRATELLPRNLPELRAAIAAAAIFERIFKRPLPQEVLPFDTAEALTLRDTLPVAESALAALWERLRRYDASGRVHQVLHLRSRRAPVRPPRSGPELLLHAAFWHDLARSRLSALLEARLVPLAPREEELPELLEWVAAREAAPGARLHPSERLGEGRAALLELAAELAALSRLQASTPSSEQAWARLEAAAWRARHETGPEVERLRAALRLLIRLRGQAHTPARLFSPERAQVPSGPSARDVEDLPALAERARAAARGAAPGTLLPAKALSE